MLNLINEQKDIDKIYLYAKDLSKPKYEYLIKNCENAGIKHVNDDMIADIVINKKFQAIIKELFIRCRKINISIVFITQSYFSVPTDVRLNSTHYFIMKSNNNRELRNIAINHSADIYYKDFMKICRGCTKEPYNFLTIDITLPSSNPL